MEVQYLQSTADMWSAVRCGSHGGVKGGKMRAVLCAERCLGRGGARVSVLERRYRFPDIASESHCDNFIIKYVRLKKRP